MEEELNISQRIFTGFSKLEYTFDVYEKYPPIYNELKGLIPKTETSFIDFNLNTCLGCEIICAAICHSINWDFLRKAVKQKTVNDVTWLDPENLSKITPDEIQQLLKSYEKKDRIRALERSKLLVDIGKNLLVNQKSFKDLFFDPTGIRRYEEIQNSICQFNAFSKDPAKKKFRLLIQCVSDYDDLSNLSDYYEPTIDYHIIRLYLRRGVIIPVRHGTLDYILNNDIIRKESTIGAIRLVCAESMDDISYYTQIDVKNISRIEWWVARTVCINGTPDCTLLGNDTKWLRNCFKKCPFYYICQARKEDNAFLTIDEPKYGGESY